MRSLRLSLCVLSQDDLKDQAQKLEQCLTEAEAAKSQLQAELQGLQHQLSQNQEGKTLQAGREAWREGSLEWAVTGLTATLQLTCNEEVPSVGVGAPGSVSVLPASFEGQPRKTGR